MASLGSLIIELVANTGKFETDLGRAARAAEKRGREISQSISKIGGKVGTALAGVVSLRVIGGAISNAIQLGDELAKAAQKSGIATREFSELAYAARQSDVDLASLSAALKKMQVAFSEARGGNKGTLATLRAIGVTLEELKANAPDRQFELIGDAISRLKDPADRTRAAVELFGKAGADLLPLFADGAQGVRLLRAEAEKLGKTLDDAGAKQLQAADDAMKKLTASWEGLAQTAAIKLGPMIARDLDSIRGALGGLSEIEKLTREVETLRAKQKSSTFTNLFGKFDDLGFFPSDADFEKAIAARQKRLRALKPLATHNRGATLIDPEAPPGFESEVFAKLQNKLKEQIALYGQVGEAARLAYQIQQGKIEGLTDAEGKQVIALAKTYDALVKNAEAQKAEAEARRAATDELSQNVASLEREVAVYGLAATEVLEYDLAHGKLAETFKLAGAESEQYAQRLRELTAALEDKKAAAVAAEEAERRHKDMMAEGAAIIEATLTPLEKYNRELERLNELRASGAFEQQGANPDEVYARAVEQAKEAMGKAINDPNAFQDQFRDGIFRSLSDGIYTAMREGSQRGWEGFRDAAIQTIQRILADQIAQKLASLLFGGTGGGGGVGSFVSKIFGGGRAVGGPVDPGRLYRINEREPEFFVPRTSGQVVPLSKMPAGGGRQVFNTTINVTGRVDQRTAQQVSIEQARRARMNTARLGGA